MSVNFVGQEEETDVQSFIYQIILPFRQIAVVEFSIGKKPDALPILSVTQSTLVASLKLSSKYDN